MNFHQNRKLQAESEKTCTRLMQLRRIFSEEKPELPILFLPKTESGNRTETTNRNSHQDRKTLCFLVQKPKNRFKKLAEIARPTKSCPLHPPPPPPLSWPCQIRWLKRYQLSSFIKCHKCAINLLIPSVFGTVEFLCCFNDRRVVLMTTCSIHLISERIINRTAIKLVQSSTLTQLEQHLIFSKQF